MRELVQSDAPPYVPPGRPVPRFVAGLLAVAAVLVGVAVLGPFHARVDVAVGEWRNVGDRAVVRGTVTNTGRFPIEAQAFTGQGLLEPAPLLDADVTSPEIEAGLPLGSVRLDPGASIVVTAELRPDCAAYLGGPGGPPLELETEVLLGFRRSAAVGGSSVGDPLSQIAGTVCQGE